MKVQYVLANITTAGEPVIAHGCNAQGVMGSGVAKVLRDAFPELYTNFKNVYNHVNGEVNLGDVIWVDIVSSGKTIANCITQRYYGRDGARYVNYNAVRDCMFTINKRLKENNINTLAMPMIGSGLGGGDWFRIKKIIEETLTDVEPRVYLLDENLMADLLEAQQHEKYYEPTNSIK